MSSLELGGVLIEGLDISFWDWRWLASITGDDRW